ncbi:MAG TPA: SPOR domain-containing protein [Pyrinomonadaceae bacterium]|jgi:hypothetical protein
MATDTHKYADGSEFEAPHSALEEFSRDERRPAVLLLGALVIAAIFFAIGIMVGRWTAARDPGGDARPGAVASPAATPAPGAQGAQDAAAPAAPNPSAGNSAAAQRRFAVLIATYDAPEKAQPIIKSLQDAGYADVRTTRPRASDPQPRYSVLVGRYSQEEARQAVKQMLATNNPRLKYVRVVEDSGN